MAAFGEMENIIILVIYGASITLGLITNFCVIYIYYQCKKKTQFCKFLLHLSLLNVGQLIGIIPYLTVNQTRLSIHKYLQSFLCAITDGHGAMLVFSLASCMLITFMSILRCDKISRRCPKWVSDKNLDKIFIGIWSLGCIAFIPYLLSYKLDTSQQICVRAWLISDLSGTIYMAVLYIIGLMIPLSTMTITCIVSYLKLYDKDMNGRVVVKRKRKRIIMLLCILVFVYVLQWFPYSVYWIMSYTTFKNPSVNVQTTRIKVLRYVLLPAVIGTFINPILYAYKWKDFQRVCRKQVPCCFHGELTESISSSRVQPHSEPLRRKMNPLLHRLISAEMYTSTTRVHFTL